MLVSFNWLREFVEIDRSVHEIADLLTMGGIEVENVTHVGEGLEKVLTARVDEISLHPSTGSLHLAGINLGGRSEKVVCGAPNLKVGQIVPYAPPGASLPSGLEIAAREIRGVLSPGMICSERELGLGDDQSGILELDSATVPGLPLTSAFPFIDDYILETGVTPNRGDCLSILGTAREVAALTGKEWRLPEMDIREAYGSIHDRMTIEVPDVELCLRYVARKVDGVKIGPSPLDVRLKLIRSGLRPISNVVDATNLILLECGQPLHAFDHGFLEDHKIVVRRSDPGETFVTLDGAERKLPPDALMIRDGKRAVALAGIMGGLNSEISADTTAVLIESACFERFGIRRTAKALGMSTEASFRFERGVDPEGTLWAAHRSAYLIWKLAGGDILSGIIDVYPRRITRPSVRVRAKKVNRFLGTNLTKKEMMTCLNRLKIDAKGMDRETFEATPPSWRWDLDREEDMIEEVARIHGFQRIPISMPSYRSAPDRTRERHIAVRGIAGLMNASGFTEVITMSFVSRREAEEFQTAGDAAPSPLSLINPLTEDQTVMRTSLIPGLLSAMKRNVSFRLEDLKLYEIGMAFLTQSGQELPREELRLAGLATGARYPGLWHFHRGEIDARGKLDAAMLVDFYDVKGALENVLEGLGIGEARYAPSNLPFLHPGASADLLLGNETIGFAGELAPAKAREHDLNARVYIFEILLEPLLIRSRKERVFKPLPRYPYIERDLSFIVEEKVSGDVIKHLISRLGHDIIASVVLFDLYRGESIPPGHQSVAYRIRYQSEDRTLTDEEAQEVHSRIVDALEKEVGARMRE